MMRFNFSKFLKVIFLFNICLITPSLFSQQSNVVFDCIQDIRLNSATLNQITTNTYEIDFLFDYNNSNLNAIDVDVIIDLDASTNLVVDPFTITLDPNINQVSSIEPAIPNGNIGQTSNGILIYIPDDMDLAGSIELMLNGNVCSIAPIDCEFVNNVADLNPENDDFAVGLPMPTSNTNDEENNTEETNNEDNSSTGNYNGNTNPANTGSNSTNLETDKEETNEEDDIEFNYNESAENYAEIKNQFLLEMGIISEIELNENSNDGYVTVNNNENEEDIIVKNNNVDYIEAMEDEEDENELINGRKDVIINVDELFEIDQVYPNPAKKYTYVRVSDNNVRRNNTLVIYNAQFKPIKKVKLNALKNQISVDNWQKGIYYLKMVNNDRESSFKKLIVY